MNSSWTFFGKVRRRYDLATLPFTTWRQPVYKVQHPTPWLPIYTVIGVYYYTNNIFRETFPAFYVILYNISSGFMNQSLTYIGNVIFKIKSTGMDTSHDAQPPSEENYAGGLTIQYKLLLASITILIIYFDHFACFLRHST